MIKASVKWNLYTSIYLIIFYQALFLEQCIVQEVLLKHSIHYDHLRACSKIRESHPKSF